MPPLSGAQTTHLCCMHSLKRCASTAARVPRQPGRLTPVGAVSRVAACVVTRVAKVALEPLHSEPCDGFQRAGLLKQVRRAGNDDQILRAFEQGERRAIKFDDVSIEPADHQQRRRVH